MTKKTYPLKACPWCNTTPKFVMATNPGQTWLPRIECDGKCKVKPKTNYVPIRKTQKLKPDVIKQKIEKVISYWNAGNLSFLNEGFELDYEKIVELHKKDLLGKKGYENGS